jgi:hypothetical protein
VCRCIVRACTLHLARPENVLFEDGGAGSSSLCLKLIDFGYAALHQPGERLRGLSGTPDYVAPEVLSWYEGEGADDRATAAGGARPPERAEYDASCDMWSVGVILYILLCGFPPFYAEGEAELIAKVRSGRYQFTSPYWDEMSDDAKDLISRCLSVDPSNRPSPTEALMHSFLQADTARAASLAASPPPHQAPAMENAPSPRHTAAAAAPAHAPAPRVAKESINSGELIARIRQMRRTYAPGRALVERAGASAPALRLTLQADGPCVGEPPSRASLKQQGATFVKVPRGLFQDIYALADAQRRGEMPSGSEQPLTDALQRLSAEVQRGAVGQQLHD